MNALLIVRNRVQETKNDLAQIKEKHSRATNNGKKTKLRYLMDSTEEMKNFNVALLENMSGK